MPDLYIIASLAKKRGELIYQLCLLYLYVNTYIIFIYVHTQRTVHGTKPSCDCIVLMYIVHTGSPRKHETCRFLYIIYTLLNKPASVKSLSKIQ